MPWINTLEDDYADYYNYPCYAGSDYSNADINALLEKKKQHTRNRELFNSYQKQYGKDDREFGRFMREEAAHELKMYRGCCHVLAKIFAEPSGDCIGLEASKEIAPYIDSNWTWLDLQRLGGGGIDPL